MYKGDEFYDVDKVYEAHRSRRVDPNTPNETLEKPVIMELAGDVKGMDILDLGCGDGSSASEWLDLGCASYLGLESSHKLVDYANQNLNHPAVQVILTRIEDWDYPPNQFDLVISRLALHYVADLAHTFRNAYLTLRPGGRFVFSIIHPVITSCDRSREGGGQRHDWIVDDYFVPGSRSVYFMGERVEQFHRTIEDIFTALQDANFTVEHLRESYPQPKYFADAALFERRRRIPLFLFFAARKE
jgi:SAM-dependent methyltransferase